MDRRRTSPTRPRIFLSSPNGRPVIDQAVASIAVMARNKS